MFSFLFRNVDKLTCLTTLNLSNTGVSCSVSNSDTDVYYVHMLYFQRDFTNTPNLDKLVNLTDIDMSHNELSRSKKHVVTCTFYVILFTASLMSVVPEPVYLLENLQRVNMSHNCIKELSSLVDTWVKLVSLDLSFNQVSALHVSLRYHEPTLHLYKPSYIVVVL